MNLIIDVGNSFIKLAIFEKDEMVKKKTISLKDFESQLKEMEKEFPKLSYAIVSSVGEFSEKISPLLNTKLKVHILTHKSKLPFKNFYQTPTTLGVDRIALVSAAAFKYPKKNVLMIDAGTCITYDFLNYKKEYLGGGISPGITMRYKAMHTFTSKLPLLEPTKPNTFIGDSTKISMDVGVVQGVANEIEGFISLYQHNFSDLTTILTGGDAQFLRDSIKNDIFANSNFLLEGLNHILELNKDSF
ncbi:MAG: type III pantothenate kinase [Flavobacteriaceae bacterium]